MHPFRSNTYVQPPPRCGSMQLVQRLDRAEAEDPETFRLVVEALGELVYPQLARSPLSGRCSIELSSATLVANAELAIDILFDRGFVVWRGKHHLDVQWDAPRLRRS